MTIANDNIANDNIAKSLATVIEVLFADGKIHQLDLISLSKEEKNEVLVVTYEHGEYRVLKRHWHYAKLQELI